MHRAMKGNELKLVVLMRYREIGEFEFYGGSE